MPVRDLLPSLLAVLLHGRYLRAAGIVRKNWPSCHSRVAWKSIRIGHEFVNGALGVGSYGLPPFQKGEPFAHLAELILNPVAKKTCICSGAYDAGKP
jgi:hypothetical protein